MTSKLTNHSVSKEALENGSFQISVYEGRARPRVIECENAAEADRVYFLEFEKQRQA
jgi:hypothetical protein